MSYVFNTWCIMYTCPCMEMDHIIHSTGATHLSVRESWKKIWSNRIIQQAECEKIVMEGLLKAKGTPSVCVFVFTCVCVCVCSHVCVFSHVYVYVSVWKYTKCVKVHIKCVPELCICHCFIPECPSNWQPLLHFLTWFGIPEALQIMKNWFILLQ